MSSGRETTGKADSSGSFYYPGTFFFLISLDLEYSYYYWPNPHILTKQPLNRKSDQHLFHPGYKRQRDLKDVRGHKDYWNLRADPAQ